MALTSIIALVLTFFVALLASWALLLPFFEGPSQAENEAAADELADVYIKKERTLDALEDLEQDLKTERISGEDYSDAKQELYQQAAEYISALEAGTAAATADGEKKSEKKPQRKKASGKK